MREIKFRAWSENLKRILPVNSIDMDGRMIVSLRHLSEMEKANAGFHDQNAAVYWYGKGGGGNVLLQYTGLTDKNGKDVYEGDIVKFRSHPAKMTIAQVTYDEASARFMASYEGGWHSFQHYNQLEIVGNIYETPHLLTNEQ